MATATVTAQRIRIPQEGEFGADETHIPAPALEALAVDLIARHPETLGDLADLQIAVLWRKKGGTRGGRPVMGKTSKRSGLLSAFTTADAIVWLAADNVADAGYSERQIEALLLHELQHVGVEENEETGVRKVVMRGHDVELFFADIRINGAWDELLKEAAEAFRQAPMFVGDD